MRIGIDLDGTLADLASAWRAIDERLFGPRGTASVATQDERDADEAATPTTGATRLAGERAEQRRRLEVWRAIRSTPDFWTTLEPLEPGVVRRLHTVALERRWEVFFLTQRPATAGDTVQRQTQRWLVAQGFDQPSVLTLTGSRGAAAAALYLDVLVDDLPRNCLDVVAESRCRPFLVLPKPDEATAASARRLDVTVVSSVGEAIDRLQEPDAVGGRTRSRRPVLSLAALFGRGGE